MSGMRESLTSDGSQPGGSIDEQELVAPQEYLRILLPQRVARPTTGRQELRRQLHLRLRCGPAVQEQIGSADTGIDSFPDFHLQPLQEGRRLPLDERAVEHEQLL